MSNRSEVWFVPPGFGWVRDLPDPKDYTIATTTMSGRYWHATDRSPSNGHVERSSDFSHYFAQPESQNEGENSSTAFACTSVFEYFFFRLRGRHSTFSKDFVHHNAIRLQRFNSDVGVSIRNVLKAIKRFGSPQDHYCKTHSTTSFSDPFLYGFKSFFEHFDYLRIDNPNDTHWSLNLMKAFLDSEIPVVFGVSVPSGISRDGLFSYFPITNSIVGGQCLVAVGFDDEIHFDHQIPKGAVLVRNSWGCEWGDRGYGWVPYRYFETGLAADCWVVLDERWFYTGAARLKIGQRLIREIELGRSEASSGHR